ncbi:MAG: hypothetical protein K2G60_00750 [Oscillospiraceae bacterium]|nr:hypothetical protein [Oscillospiraceae bacterium]
MNKKILLVSAIILILTVSLTACKGKKDDAGNESNTDKVVQTVTVTGKDGGVTNVEIFEDASGDKYITNVDGEKIPLTTDEQGYSDDIGYIVTSKPANDKKPDSSSNTVKPTDGNNPTESSQPSSSATDNSTAPENSTGGGIVIDSKVPQDSISWDDIKNPKK